MRVHDHRSAFSGATLLGLLAIVASGCGGDESKPPPAHASGGSVGSGGSESATGGRALAGTGGTPPATGGASVGSGGTAGTGGLSTSGGAAQSTGGAAPGSGGVGTGGVLASGGSGGAADPDSGTCTYPIPGMENQPECTSSVCKSDEGYEIRISTAGGFYVGHLIWVLNACDVQFHRSRNLNGSLTTLQFLLTEGEFESLPVRLPLSAFYGSPGNQTGAGHMSCGTVNLTNPPGCSPE